MSQTDEQLHSVAASRYGITIDRTRNDLLAPHSIERLKEAYMSDLDTDPQDRFAFVSRKFSSSPEHAQRLYDYSSKLWLSYATPILAYGRNRRGLPISCFATNLEDTMESLLETSTETRMLAVVGGGVGLHVGLRPGDKKSAGIMPHLKTYDDDTLAYKQGSCYHPDVEVLTEQGWMTFEQASTIPGLKVLEVGVDGSTSWVVPEWVKQQHTGHLIHFKDSKNIDLKVTPNHRMFFKASNNQLFTVTSAEELEMSEDVHFYRLSSQQAGDVVELESFEGTQVSKQTLAYDGLVYCAVVPKGGLVIRSNGHTLVCGNTRRGATAAYLNVNHPEIQEFIEMRKPTGGDPNRKCLNLHHGVNLTDDFMWRIEQLSTNPNLSDTDREELDKFPLVNPATKKIEKYASAKQLWQQLLDVRLQTGEPYFWFIDTANEKLPQAQKNLGLENHGSNLCSEISLATGRDHLNNLRTFVCCLSSINLERYEEWKDHPTFIEDIVEMLDNVVTVFIEEASAYPALKNAVYAASRERSIGIGALGWHYLLQSKGIAIDSPMAVGLNKRIWQNVDERTLAATKKLAAERGACPDSIEGGAGDIRNMHRTAIAPNASSSQILDTSPSIEPVRANIYTEKGITGSITKKNKYLVNLLKKYNIDNTETWSTILAHAGSVQHLSDKIPEYELAPFKTAMEIDQVWLIQHAIDRQPYISQAQSLNLFFPSDVDISYLHASHLLAWQGGLKSLYYCRSVAASKASVAKVERIKIEELVAANASSNDEEVCISCQG